MPLRLVVAQAQEFAATLRAPFFLPVFSESSPEIPGNYKRMTLCCL
jgi:hypothetical protein